VLRLLLLLVGLLTLIGLVWHIGPENILDAVSRLGPTAVLVILLPSLLMYVLEAWGWRLTLGPHAAAVPFWRLFLIRTAGEVVNMTTPTAYVGGEPLKAYLLKDRGVPLVEGLASVVIAKTAMTIAQVAFILLSIAAAFWYARGRGGSDKLSLAAGLVSVGLLLFGTVMLVTIQRHGLFSGLLQLLRWFRLHIRFLERRAQRLAELDRTIMTYYAQDRRGFLLSIALFFLGWLAEALEVSAMLFYLDVPADALRAIAIGGLSVFIKGGTFFIPGSVGAQEGGNLMLLVAFGYTELTGITFALLRRFRELVWIGIGLAVLAATRRDASPATSEKD
jgi:uncharacterized protein (TIRG00374 family)